MLAIHAEIKAIESGSMDRANNPLKNAPHVAQVVVAENGNVLQSRAGGFPSFVDTRAQVLAFRRRVDNVYGDRHVVCTCLPVEAYTSASRTTQLNQSFRGCRV